MTLEALPSVLRELCTEKMDFQNEESENEFMPHKRIEQAFRLAIGALKLCYATQATLMVEGLEQDFHLPEHIPS